MKKLILIALAVCATRLASAAEVTAAQAQAAVDAWLQDDAALGCALGRAAESTRTCTATNGAPFHVVKLAGGGFVVTSADTTVEPIIAFSDDDDLIESEENPLWTLLTRDLALRMADAAAASGTKGRLKLSATSSGNSANEAKWNRLLGKSSGLLRASQGVSFVSDVRVAPLVQSKWGQSKNSMYSNRGEKCYNYYTPNNYVCGCVATAMAQIMRYHRYPASVTAQSRTCKVDGVSGTYQMRGGTYDYDNMVLVPESESSVDWFVDGATEVQRKAIGQLTYDCGVAMCMNWNAQNSSSYGGYAHDPLVNVFGYANARSYLSGATINQSDLYQMMLPNFDAGYPVMLGVVGHEVVADGYGFSDETLYTHLNMGWSGVDDAWYNLPDVSTDNIKSSFVQSIIYNIYPTGTGDILSGRITDEDCNPVLGATVSVALASGGTVLSNMTTGANGIYAFRLMGGQSYRVTATYGTSVQSSDPIALVASGNPKSVDLVNNSYVPTGMVCGNSWGNDIQLTGLASVESPVFSPAGGLFHPSDDVAISCATEGATIRYTMDGSDPDETSAVYDGPVAIAADTTFKARAYKDGMNPSALAEAVYVYDVSQDGAIGDYFANPIVISGASGSHVINDNADYTVEGGEPNHTGYYQYHTIWYKWTAPGSGTMTLQTFCSGGGYRYPTFIAVYTGDTLTLDNRQVVAYEYDKSTYVTTLNLDVEQGVTYRIVGMMGYDGSGRFTLTWSGDLTVAPTEPTETETTEVPVPHSWLETYLPELSGGSGASDYEAAAVADSDGDGFANWQEFLLGTDPTNETSRFSATIDFVNGQPVFGWSVTNENLSTLGYQYAPKGTTSLAPPNWVKWDGHPFFKVVIEPNP